MFAQTYSVDDVYVIDDGSVDDTACMIDRFYPQVKYIYQNNGGVSSARNLGIRHAKSDWIALLDSDDEWLPNKLESQILEHQANPEIRISHTDEIWVRNGIRVNPKKKHAKQGGWIFQNCLPLCAMSPSSVLIHRTLFEQVGLFDELMPACEDYDLWLRICSRFPVLYLSMPLLVKHGGHSDQLSRKYWGMDRFRIRALQRVLAQDYLAVNDRRAAREMLRTKATVYANGARKRDKLKEAVKYEAICQQYSDLT